MTPSERIIAILDHYSLKAADFATSANLVPATISNLKNGKSGMTSLIAQKIKTAFPDLNFQWILLGEGSMFQTAENKSTTDDFLPIKRHTDELFPIDSDENTKDDEFSINKKGMVTNVSAPVMQNEQERTIKSNIQDSAHIEVEQKVRMIEKIIIYYNDKTFEEYDMTKCKI